MLNNYNLNKRKMIPIDFVSSRLVQRLVQGLFQKKFEIEALKQESSNIWRLENLDVVIHLEEIYYPKKHSSSLTNQDKYFSITVFLKPKLLENILLLKDTLLEIKDILMLMPQEGLLEKLKNKIDNLWKFCQDESKYFQQIVITLQICIGKILPEEINNKKINALMEVVKLLYVNPNLIQKDVFECEKKLVNAGLDTLA